MALVNRSLMLDITPGAIPLVVNVSEYDENRQFTVNLIDEGGVFEIPSGTTAKVEGTIGGSGFSANATISGDTITFTLTESMTAKAGDVWCKIKLTKDSKPIQTCAFILRCDRAGVEAETVIGAPGFQEQISQGVAEYFDNDPPFFELPSGGQSGQALLSDGADGAVWGEAGIPEAVKTALLACFENAAWINQNGNTYYQALYDALYAETPVPPSSKTKFSWDYTQGLPTDFGCTIERPENGTISMESNGVLVTCTSNSSNIAVSLPAEYIGKLSKFDYEFTVVPVSMSNANFGGISLSINNYAEDPTSHPILYTTFRSSGVYTEGSTKVLDFVLQAGTEYKIKRSGNAIYIDDNLLITIQDSSNAPSAAAANILAAISPTAFYLRAIRVIEK